MTGRSTSHATFTIERVYDARPARVFAAWAEIEAKGRWFVGPEVWTLGSRTFDFRVGGREHLSGVFAGGPRTRFDALYLDIVEGRRIVYSYDMHLNDKRISISLATVELLEEDGGTRLVFTEQAVFMDGFEDPDGAGRKHGTEALFDRFGAYLAGR